MPHQEVDRPPTQQPERDRHGGKREQENPGEFDRPPALPSLQNLPRQFSQPVGTGEEVILQDPLVGRENQPIGLFGIGEDQATRGVRFEVESVQSQFDAGSVRIEQKPLLFDPYASRDLLRAECWMKRSTDVRWNLRFHPRLLLPEGRATVKIGIRPSARPGESP